jgi:predicted transcriptional regulator YdeE
MISEDVTLEEFFIAGISVHTSNKNGQSKKDISELWGRFMNENIAEKIHNKVNGNLYCIYTDYESDFMGMYTTILGYSVSTLEGIPDGLTGEIIPVLNYKLFKSTGKLPDCVLNTWKEIWESGIKRKYLVDFDVYPPDAFISANPIVETYLSV